MGQLEPDLEFFYDAMRNRVRKIVKPRTNGVLASEGQWIETIYVRDGRGKTLSSYDRTYNVLSGNTYEEVLEQSCLDIYGNKRLGTYNREAEVGKIEFTASINGGEFSSKTITNSSFTFDQEDEWIVYKNKKCYELTNHLDNVLVVISDNKVPVHEGGSSTTVTVMMEDFSQGPGSWNPHPSAGFMVSNNTMHVFPQQPEDGIINYYSHVPANNCTNEYCFELDENAPLPSGLQLVFINKHTGLVESTHDITAKNMCFPVDFSQVDGIAFVSNFMQNFSIMNVSIKETCPQLNFVHYAPIVKQRQDYYPFGMLMPGRGVNSGTYTYGFQGQTQDNELYGNGNSYSAEFWQYDPRLGRRWNVDPVIKSWKVIIPPLPTIL